MEMFVLKCNHCGDYASDDNDYGQTFFHTGDEARQNGENNCEWYTHGDKHFCKKCYKIDKDDIMHIGEDEDEQYDLSLEEPMCYKNLKDTED